MNEVFIVNEVFIIISAYILFFCLKTSRKFFLRVGHSCQNSNRSYKNYMIVTGRKKMLYVVTKNLLTTESKVKLNFFIIKNEKNLMI